MAHRRFTVHFQYFAEIEPHTFKVPAPYTAAPSVEGNVLYIRDIDGVCYQYNWDLIAHTTLTKEEPTQ